MAWKMKSGGKTQAKEGSTKKKEGRRTFDLKKTSQPRREKKGETSSRGFAYFSSSLFPPSLLPFLPRGPPPPPIPLSLTHSHSSLSLF